MGRREAWSAEKSSDSRTKPTHWEFRRRDHHHENIEADNFHETNAKRVRSADDKRAVKIKYVYGIVHFMCVCMSWRCHENAYLLLYYSFHCNSCGVVVVIVIVVVSFLRFV